MDISTTFSEKEKEMGNGNESGNETYTTFFYGTLMAPTVLYRVLYGLSPSPSNPTSTTTSKLHSVSALLQNYTRHRVIGCDYPAIIPSEEKILDAEGVRGTLVSGLSKRDVFRLDVFEGEEYERRDVDVRVLPSSVSQTPTNTKTIKAQTYIWIDPKTRLEDREWDFEEFVREKLGRWEGSSSGEFEEVDGVVYDGEGDPMGGRGMGGRIGEALRG
ncbi:MAG: hypothetical protein M1834_005048 [Cirrosporium novae-zelandiae]|nr:MAG: hypothetical protein M1834_005048 [Cirrosporium novae-zelandiae]